MKPIGERSLQSFTILHHFIYTLQYTSRHLITPIVVIHPDQQFDQFILLPLCLTYHYKIHPDGSFGQLYIIYIISLIITKCTQMDHFGQLYIIYVITAPPSPHLTEFALCHWSHWYQLSHFIAYKCFGVCFRGYTVLSMKSFTTFSKINWTTPPPLPHIAETMSKIIFSILLR